MYPQNKDEAEKFSAGLIKSLHSDQTREKTMQVLTDERVPVAARLATVVSNIMTAMLSRVKNQADRQPHAQLLVQSIRMLIIEASRMAMIAGVKVTDEDKRNAAKLAGDMIESGFQSQEQQPVQQQSPMPQQQPMQQAQQPQQQGLIGGAM